MWAHRWLLEKADIDVVLLDVANNNPAEARRIAGSCTCTEIADAWVNIKRTSEGVGFE